MKLVNRSVYFLARDTDILEIFSFVLLFVQLTSKKLFETPCILKNAITERIR